jgi:nicotinamidase-related amidase
VTANTFERIDRNNAALLIIDHQVGLVGAVRDYSVQEMYNNIVLHATLGKTYNLPVVITSSTDQGNAFCLPFLWWDNPLSTLQAPTVLFSLRSLNCTPTTPSFTDRVRSTPGTTPTSVSPSRPPAGSRSSSPVSPLT